MSGWDDLPYEMPIGTIDEDTTDRLLAGRIHPDDAPPGYAGVARILQAAGSLPRSEHLSREAELVAAARGRIENLGDEELAAVEISAPLATPIELVVVAMFEIS